MIAASSASSRRHFPVSIRGLRAGSIRLLLLGAPFLAVHPAFAGWNTNVAGLSTTQDQVGIGTLTPTSPFKLDVRGGGTFSPYVRLNNGGAEWEVGSDATASGFYIYKNAVGATPGSYKLVVNNTGLVGIGTTSAKAGLHINNVGNAINGTQGDRGFLLLGTSGGKQVQADDDEIQAMNGNAQSNLFLNYAGGDVITNVSGGRVGIGTATPAFKLDVRGGGAFMPYARLNNGGAEWEVGSDASANGFYIYKVGVGGAAGSYKVVVDNGGNVGVGTTTPAFKLDVRGGGAFMPYARLNNGGAEWEVGSDATANGFYVYKNAAGGAPGRYMLVVDNGGKVGIGLDRQAPSEMLEVAGNIKAQNIIVTSSVRASSWSIAPPDYVFEDGYRPMSLEDVEKYTREHKHLPEIPSAKRMESEGLDLAEMNLRLLKKVEELTLHAIRQEKLLAAQESRLRKLEGRGR